MQVGMGLAAVHRGLRQYGTVHPQVGTVQVGTPLQWDWTVHLQIGTVHALESVTIHTRISNQSISGAWSGTEAGRAVHKYVDSHENQLHISRDKGTIYQIEPCWNGSDDTIKYEANDECHQLLLSRQLACSCSYPPPLPVTM
jgi:hypothetical protein